MFFLIESLNCVVSILRVNSAFLLPVLPKSLLSIQFMYKCRSSNKLAFGGR